MQDHRYEIVFESGNRVRLCEVKALTSEEADRMALEAGRVFADDANPGKPYTVVEYQTVFRTAGTLEWRTATNELAAPIRIPERWRRTTLLRQVAADAINKNPAITRHALTEIIIEACNASEVGHAQSEN